MSFSIIFPMERPLPTYYFGMCWGPIWVEPHLNSDVYSYMLLICKTTGDNSHLLFLLQDMGRHTT